MSQILHFRPLTAIFVLALASVGRAAGQVTERTSLKNNVNRVKSWPNTGVASS